MGKAAARQTSRVGREIHLDHIGDVNGRNISAVSLDARYVRLKDKEIEQPREFRLECILAEQLRIIAWAGATVEILVHNSNEGLVEKRVALTPNLHPIGRAVIVSAPVAVIISQDAHLWATGRRIDTGDLLVAAKFVHRNSQCYHMKVKTSLRVFARAAQFQQIEHRLDVRIEAIVSLTCESQVAPLQWGNCLLGVKVKVSRV